MASRDGILRAEDDCSVAVERYMRRLRSCSPTFYYIGRFLFRRVFAIALKIFFLALFVEVFFFVYLVALPFETLYKPIWLIYAFHVFGFYLFACTVLYFFMSSLTSPGHPLKDTTDLPLCRVCENHKPPRAHHCSVCGVCVLKMDHHCVWLNQCIGARNHRYFVQFLGYLSFGMLFLLTAAHNTFYRNISSPDAESYCGAGLDDFLGGVLCGGGGVIVVTLTFFNFMLTIVCIVLVGGFFLWNCALVSVGTTYIECLQRVIMGGSTFADLPPIKNVAHNWKIFLGLDGQRSFWRHILLPSFHVSELYVEEATPLATVQLKEVYVH
ncbi:hypothetical protein QR680_004998 [Steinernema hermaphroditum]|uniref:Palmitoyltransferase n=1 Tax=Steinernema hermaphroditum TaxID=289476 RepID=A0AA39HRQ6_9BILA|nr:hypothetical protein QR680_004998 [Steinernema hermaphroditum]